MSSLHIGLGVRLLGRSGACAGGRIGASVGNVDAALSTPAPSLRSFTTQPYKQSTVCGTIRRHGILRPFTPTAISLRYNSSSPNSAKPASPALIASESQQPAGKDSRSAFAKFRASLSLADQSHVTSEESATSGVKKLLNLARPESRQLGIAVGLVSLSISVCVYDGAEGQAERRRNECLNLPSASS